MKTPPRQTKTPAQRAQEAADVALRRLHRLQKKHRDLTDQVELLDDEINDAEMRLEYVYADPALPAQTKNQKTTTTQETP